MSKKHIFFIHGRSFKPEKNVLSRLWFQAVAHGLKRDTSTSVQEKYKKAKKSFIYYGDLSNSYLRGLGQPYDESADTEDRKLTHKDLKRYNSVDFQGRVGKAFYNSLAGKDAGKEMLADIFATPLDFFHLSEALITRVAPDMRAYWNADSAFGSEIRWRLTEPLAKALSRNDDVLVVSHSLGTLVSFDVLWKFSHYSEYTGIRNRSINTWLTLGSPLGNETVKKNLKGARAVNARRYPSNIQHWINIAAEDDYISHDQSLKDDYKNMKQLGLIKSLKDHRVFNLAMREGRSNPHNSSGYLVHPRTIDVIANWL
jgi:hypothetical protein